MRVLKSRSGYFVLRGIVVSPTTNLGLTLRSRRWL